MQMQQKVIPSSPQMAERILSRMRERDISRIQLSNEAHLSYRLVHYVCSGENRGIRRESVRRIAEALGVRFDWLVKGIEPKSEPAVRDPADGHALYDQTPPSVESAPGTLSVGWEDRLHRAILQKKHVIEAGCNEFGLPLADALRPAVKAFIEGERK